MKSTQSRRPMCWSQCWLEDSEVAQIVAFLNALTDAQSLRGALGIPASCAQRFAYRLRASVSRFSTTRFRRHGSIARVGPHPHPSTVWWCHPARLCASLRPSAVPSPKCCGAEFRQRDLRQRLIHGPANPCRPSLRSSPQQHRHWGQLAQHSTLIQAPAGVAGVVIDFQRGRNGLRPQCQAIRSASKSTIAAPARTVQTGQSGLKPRFNKHARPHPERVGCWDLPSPFPGHLLHICLWR